MIRLKYAWTNCHTHLSQQQPKSIRQTESIIFDGNGVRNDFDRRHIDAARPIFERIAAQPAWQRAAAINAGASTYSQGGITPR